MRIRLPNPFDPNSTSRVPDVDDAGASTPATLSNDASASLSESDGVGAKPILASSPSEAVTVSVRAPVAADIIQSSCGEASDECLRTRKQPSMASRLTPPSPQDHIGEIFRGAKALFEPYPIPRLALPPFAPDYEAMQAAVRDPSAPRALETDPVWADALPAFLQRVR